MKGYNTCICCNESQVKGAKGAVCCDECKRKVREHGHAHQRMLVGRERVNLDRHPYLPGYAEPFDRDRAPPAAGAKGYNERGRLRWLLTDLRSQLPESDWHHRSEYADEQDLPLAEARPEFASDRYDMHGKPTYIVPAPFGRFLAELDTAIARALNEAVADGKAQGTNLIAALAAGELTNADFEKKAGIAP